MSFVSPIGYAGGKYYMLKDVYKIILQSDFDIIVDVFGGSGKVLLNMPMNTLFGAYKGIYNDIDKQNLEFLEVVRDEPKNLIHVIENTSIDDELINECRKYGDKYRNSSKVVRAFMTWINYKYAWSGFVASNYRKSADSIDVNVEYSSEQIMMASSIVKHWNMYNLDFEKLRFLDSDRTFWYFDPPYRESDVYYYNFSDVDFVRLKRFIDSLDGKYLVNIDEDGYIHYHYGEPNMRKSYRNLMMRHEHASDREEWFYWKLV